MKKWLALSVICALLLCGALPAQTAGSGVRVVATIFPLYDWVRQIAGENSVELTLLLDKSTDLHNYQPTVSDIATIANCDLFIYVGGESDQWVNNVLSAAANPRLRTMNLMELLGEAVQEEELVEGMQAEAHAEEEEEPEGDEHIWLSLRNAQRLCPDIAAMLSELDPASKDTYQSNCQAYLQRLSELDARYQAVTDSASFHTLLFADRFPFRYLVSDYHWNYYAAFSGCSAETEASFSTIIFLAGKLDELNLPAVMTIEGADHRIAETVISTSRQKNQLILALDSMQSATLNDIQEGKTYLSTMEKNLQVLQTALQAE